MNQSASTISPQIENFRFQRWVLGLGVVLFGLKLWAWWITDSVAVFSDALESIVNITAGSISLYTLYLSALPRDENHPYGHGKAEFISAAIEGTLISVAAVIIAIKAIDNLTHPTELEELDFGMLLIFFTALVNFVMGRIAVAKGRKNQSIALEASGKHLITDTYSTLGVVIALLAIQYTKLLWLDTVASLIIAVVIGFMGYRILRQSIAGMMDEADDELLEELVNYLNTIRIPDWIDVHNLRVIKYGSILHIDCHLTVPHYYDVTTAHDLVDQLENQIREQFGSSIELFIHLDACRTFSCALCSKTDCPVRQQEFQERIEWDVQRISLNKQHQLKSRD
jgi:cation diffusion facilitator family transporter